jgi:hypothetical protein
MQQFSITVPYMSVGAFEGLSVSEWHGAALNDVMETYEKLLLWGARLLSSLDEFRSGSSAVLVTVLQPEISASSYLWRAIKLLKLWPCRILVDVSF